MPQPLYIAVEGVDGCGKSAQSRLLADRLGGIWTREPGGTSLGQSLRVLLLAPDSKLDPRTELFLMNADRVQHMAEVILPTLAAGQHVVSDRCYVSSIVYQGYCYGMSLTDAQAVCELAMGEVAPHRIFFLDIDMEHIRARRGGEGHDTTDKFELEADDFRARAITAYRAEAQRAAHFNGVLIDARGSIEEVQESIWAHVEPLLA